ncbi:MAG: LLM class flavin-dependent oxidoreductase, partial [Acidimicrobiia bacterium]
MELLVDTFLDGDVTGAGAAAAAAEQGGYDGILAAETGHDPFMHLLRVATATERVVIGTAVAIAFGRSPLT